MTNKEFVKSVYTKAWCAFYAGKKECLIVSYPNTFLFGIRTKSKTPKIAWAKAAENLRCSFLKRLES